MNRVKKSLILLLITILTIFICMPKSKAASLSITLSKTTANVGDTVNITINTFLVTLLFVKIFIVTPSLMETE